MKVQLDQLIPGNIRWGIGTVVNVADDVGRDMISAGIAHQVADGTRDRIAPYDEEACVPTKPPASKTEKPPKPPKEEETE